MKLEAGKTYLNRRGERVTVRDRPPDLPTTFYGRMFGSRVGFPFFDPYGLRTYMPDGKERGEESDHDLILEAPEVNKNPPNETPPRSRRKIVQLATSYCENPGAFVTVLCDDGTVWVRSVRGREPWLELPGIPQP